MEMSHKFLMVIESLIIITTLSFSHFFPLQWNMAQIIMIPKPNKDSIDVRSYKLISLLPIISKIFEN